MRKRIVYFLVLLAVCLFSLTLVHGAFSQSQTANIEVLDYSFYIDSLGYLVVVGQIQNIGSTTVEPVVVVGIVSSSDGNQSESGHRAWVTNLIPQQKAPFYLEFASQSSSDGTWYDQEVFDVSLSVYQADATANYLYPNLAITKSSASVSSDGVFWVNGDIQNTGTQTASKITVVATFYNSTGTTVAVGYTDPLIPANLAPSETTSFQVGAFDLNQTGLLSDKKITDYSLLIQVEAPILQGTPPVISVTPTPGPITSATPSNAGSSNSSNSLPQWIYVVVVVAIVAVAAAFLLLRKRSKPHP